MVPDSRDPAPFDGAKVGRYDKRRRSVAVEHALPLQLKGQSPAMVLRASLFEAISEAENVARKKGLADGLPDVRSIADRSTA